MIYLDTSTKTLQLSLGGAVSTTQADVVSCYYDVPRITKQDFSAYQGATHVTTSANTTHVIVVPAPPANVTRFVESLFVFNADVSTTANRFFLKMDDAGTKKILVGTALTTTQVLTYENGAGFKVV